VRDWLEERWKSERKKACREDDHQVVRERTTIFSKYYRAALFEHAEVQAYCQYSTRAGTAASRNANPTSSEGLQSRFLFTSKILCGDVALMVSYRFVHGQQWLWSLFRYDSDAN